jgi:prevent-host-death family protein
MVMKATATEVKTRFGYFLDKARREPVEIERSGRVVVVMVAVEEYEALQAALDRIDGDEAMEALKEGLMGDEGMRLLMARLAEVEGKVEA